jgi:hypothetical protein
MSQGDALLYDSDVTHQGRAHTDPNAPDRALLFITFAGSRQGPDDARGLPLGQVHALDWRMWGHTIDDCATMKERPWRFWHAFGIGGKRDNVRPWNLLDVLLIIFADENERAHVIWDDFSAEYLQNLVKKLATFTFGFAVLYISSLLTLTLVGRTLPVTMLPGKDREGEVHMNGIGGITKHETEKCSSFMPPVPTYCNFYIFHIYIYIATQSYIVTYS